MCCCQSRVCDQSLCSGFICLFHCSLCQPGNSAQVSEPIQESILPLLFVFPSFLELFSSSYAPCSAVSGSIACYLSRYPARLLAKLHFPLIQRPTSLCLLRSRLSKACGSLSDSVMFFPAAGCYRWKEARCLLWARRSSFHLPRNTLTSMLDLQCLHRVWSSPRPQESLFLLLSVILF